MQIKKINNLQSTNFGAIKLPPPMLRSSALSAEIQGFMRKNRDIEMRMSPKKISDTSCTLVDHIMTLFGSPQESELLAKLNKHDSRVIAVKNTEVKSVAVDGLFPWLKEKPIVDSVS